MDNLYKIGQVSSICEIPVKSLRFYEEEKLIKPVKVDIYTGYRFYNDENIAQVFRVKFLRELGFSIKEIRQFSPNSINEKINEIEKQIARLKDNSQMLSFLKKQKGEMFMKSFVNDDAAIGKWKYKATARSKEEYFQGQFTIDKKPNFKEFYFLPQGKGYWIFERWTKGMILNIYGDILPYTIDGDTLYIDMVTNGKKDSTLVYEKVDSLSHSADEIAHFDNTDLPFVMDKKALGLWQVVDYIDFDDKKNFKPRKDAEKNVFVKSLTINPNGEVIYEAKSLLKYKWTKGKIINPYQKLVMDYCYRDIDGQTYMIMDWKSGDYIFNGEIHGCYVLQQVK